MSGIAIRQEGITDARTEIVVNAANSALQAGSGVCGAIFSAAGYQPLQAACDAIGGCLTGNAVITPGFGMQCRYIVHAVGPIWRDGHHHEPEDLYHCYQASLDLARKYNCHSIAFPLISAGIYGCPLDLAWRKALQACNAWIRKNPDYEISIEFAIPDKNIGKLGIAELNRQMSMD